MDTYSSGLVAESFWFVEFKKFIKLLDEGKSWDEIKQLCLVDNLLGIPKEYRAKRIYGYLKNRAENFDGGMIKMFLNADLATQKIMTLIAVAKGNRLFFEFLFEVYREKVLMGALEMTISDINIFFKNKQEQSEEVANWTDVTLKRLRSTYMNFLVDAGLLTVEGKQKRLTPPILDISLERYLTELKEVQMIKAVTGVN